MIAMNFGFGALETEFWRMIFLMTRCGAALFAVPLFGSQQVPMQVRVVLAGGLAVMLCNWTTIPAPAALFSLPGLLATAGEVVIGLALGFVLQFAFAAPMIAAEMIGASMGMSIATAADPVSGAHSPALGQYFSVLLTVIFLGLGAHLQWFSLLVESYRAFPPGGGWFTPDRMGLIVGFGTQMFVSALAIALPVVLLLLLVQLTFGVLARSAPSLNIFALGLPMGVLGGIAALIASAPLLDDALTDLVALGLGQAQALLVK
ncbi:MULTISPECIES: flagellar biosynthetic protein FliR [Novosphingobium]|uniref:flagellar biosynthetic protein FliR n=2 Tax=Sphingomonadaceae TaxID=41297 RepID=UPI0003B353FD|nr:MULTISPECIES: flagellar biosynthetic protein FliR [Novosphingobium]KPF52307.1 flagellar biosynthetic protein FliR [Novosphingobium sp. AAP1]PTR05588.1 flagellar biosynthetic protein FliR [Novosphingobium sp. GV055]PUA94142.1 flagellar biosynthetic protein FliR [Novosphingobium sp. GV061]PUB11909.1 flagellar biosynthetic protein FliR [Novosphingobium sp. GV079]PUB37170.1 flagellar biosynthetic protein FliR [Novosphingobium sp. GV027]